MCAPINDGRAALERQRAALQERLKRMRAAAAKCYRVNPRSLPANLADGIQSLENQLRVNYDKLLALSRPARPLPQRRQGWMPGGHEEGRWLD